MNAMGDPNSLWVVRGAHDSHCPQVLLLLLLLIIRMILITMVITIIMVIIITIILGRITKIRIMKSYTERTGCRARR
jgi:hypothetical protein